MAALRPHLVMAISGVRVFELMILVLLAMISFSYLKMLHLRRKLPPGPFPLPMVGNFLQLKKMPWIQFEEWSQKYGDGLLTIWVGRTPYIIINDAWSASDIMEKRANIYSSRPHQVVMGDVCGLANRNQVLLKYDDNWRLQRKMMHSAVGSQAVREYRGFQGDEATVLMADMLADPDDYVLSVERYSCSVVSIVGWGRRIDRKDDYIVKIALQMMETITTMQVPGAFWMEAIPELTCLPAWIYPLPSKFRAFGNSFRSYWFALTSEGSEATEPNFAKYLLKAQTVHQLPNDHVAEMTANLIGGGVDTSSSTLISCILGLCVFQEAQLAAQEEIDRVIGQERLPDWPDMEKLPYCQALFKETLRWRSATILGGIPHAPTKDDYYRGYLLPAGIYIAGNLWAIHRDPKDFPEPDTFRPERYLGGNQRPYPNAKGHNAFGWGRRSCSGQPLAEQGLSMAIVKMLWAFHLRPGLDEQGHEVKLDIFAYTSAENTRPRPFRARFTPRSQKIQQIIFVEAKTARDNLRKWDGETKYTVEQFFKE